VAYAAHLMVGVVPGFLDAGGEVARRGPSGSYPADPHPDSHPHPPRL
jgi:hypothetical protein